jgi:hypothetical protein
MIKPQLEPTMDTDPANIPTLANNRLALPPSRKTRGRAGPLNPGALQTNQPATATHRLIKLSFFFNRRKRLAGATNVIGVVRVGKSGSNPREPGTGVSASVWKLGITLRWPETRCCRGDGRKLWPQREEVATMADRSLIFMFTDDQRSCARRGFPCLRPAGRVPVGGGEKKNGASLFQCSTTDISRPGPASQTRFSSSSISPLFRAPNFLPSEFFSLFVY